MRCSAKDQMPGNNGAQVWISAARAQVLTCRLVFLWLIVTAGPCGEFCRDWKRPCGHVSVWILFIPITLLFLPVILAELLGEFFLHEMTVLSSGPDFPK